MAPLIFILISAALAGGFLALTQWERAHGTRFLAPTRARLDQGVERAAFVIKHVDWNAYLRDEVRALAIRLGHAAAHLSLQGVRAVERLLTDAVRRLRAQVASEAAPAPGPSTRPFVQALSGFKEELKAARPEIPEL